MKAIKTDYKYLESGLPNVILKGITAYKCSKCRGINPVISKIKEVHKTIAQQLLRKDSLLTGKEIVYLRKEMNIRAKDLAQILGITKVTISRWENEKEPISPACDRLIRSLYHNRIFSLTCAIIRPGIDKLESPVLKSMLISLCEAKISIEDVFKNIKRCHVHSKISIPVSKLDILQGASDSNLSAEFTDKAPLVRFGQIRRQLGAGADSKRQDFYTAAVGNSTTVGRIVGIGTTIDDALTGPLIPSINRPNELPWASA